MKKKFNQGFTLIELLVVIAIIGILASVILASLSSARAKGTDAATKSDLSNARAQAELFYDNAQSYDTVCTTPVTPTNGIKEIVADTALKFGAGATVGAGDATPSGPLTIACHDSIAAWAISVPLKSVPGQYFCIDSTGNTKQNAIVLAGSGAFQYACQ